MGHDQGSVEWGESVAWGEAGGVKIAAVVL